MSEVPEGLYYTKEHEWMRVEGDTVTIGITDHAQDMLTDIVYIELPEEGDVVGDMGCLLYTSPSPRDVEESRMPSSA